MKRKIFSVISIITILILIFTYLNQNPNSPNNRYNINFDSYPEWTVMIYMSGDNWLSEMVSRNLGHMKSVGSTDEVNIITLMDQKGRNNSNLYHIKFQDVNETSLNELNSKYSDELNMGEEKTLIDFVTWTIDNFPAKHYLLDIWGHGKGWEGVVMLHDDIHHQLEVFVQ